MSINSLAISTLSSDITSAATTIPLNDGSIFLGETLPFYLTITPPSVVATRSNSEIVRVNSFNSSNNPVVTRAQLGTTATSFSSGAYVYRGIYPKDLVCPRQLPAGNAATASYWSGLYNSGYRRAEYFPDFEPTVTNLPVVIAREITLVSSTVVCIHGFNSSGETVDYRGKASGTSMVFHRVGWYKAGESKVANGTTAIVTLPYTNPYGIKINAAVESVTGSGWADLRTLDSSNNYIGHSWCYHAGLDDVNQPVQNSGTITGTAVGVFPYNAAWANCQMRAESVLSDPENYRSWTWQSGGGNPLLTYVGTGRQNSTTAISKVGLVVSNNSNLYIEVFIKETYDS